MESIRHLGGFRSDLINGSSKFTGSISGDDFSPRMRFEPGFELFCAAILEQIHDLMLLEVNQDRAVPLAFTKSPVVHAQNAGCCSSWWFKLFDGTQDGVATAMENQLT
jgi:hypothetical protein